MKIDGWKYYKHAALPSTPPHINPNLDPIVNRTIWRIDGGFTLFARWTTDWDCASETEWWYVIKDSPFDINSLKSKRRYEINKGLKNFYIKEINPIDYGAELFEVARLAYETYPISYRPNISYSSFSKEIEQWKFYKVYGAFSKENHSLCGYACLQKNDVYIDFCVMKAIPSLENKGLNAAMVYSILNDHSGFLSDNGYICDGSRNIQHETAFQDYLEKYFQFRKAYCRLNIKYRPFVYVIVKLLYPFRKMIYNTEVSTIKQFCGILKMEEIHRSF